MKFGIRLPVNGPFASRDAILEVLELAEQQSFDSAWTQGHLLWSSAQHRTQISVGSVEALEPAQNPNMFDTFSTLFYASGVTRKVRLGSAVFVAPLVHPVLAARLLANLDVFSGGRLIFCAAPGGPLIRKDFETLGVDFAQRAAVADECIEAILKLWTEDSASFEGRFVKFSDVSLYPKPAQKPRPPVWIAGGDPGAIGRAAKYGDGWMLTTADPRTVIGGMDEIAGSFQKLKRRAREEHGREVKDLAIDIYACVGRSGGSADDREAFDISDGTIAARLKRQAQSANLRVPTQREVESMNLIGSPSTITKKVEAFEKMGVTLLELKMICWSLEQMKEMMGVFGRDIIPSFC